MRNDPLYMKVIITYMFCCDNLWKSIIMALEKHRKLGENFFSYFVAPDIYYPIFISYQVPHDMFTRQSLLAKAVDESENESVLVG